MTASYDATELTIPVTTITKLGVGIFAYEPMWGEASKKLGETLVVPYRVVMRKMIDEEGVERPDGYQADLDEFEFEIMQAIKEELPAIRSGLTMELVEMTRRLSFREWFFKVHYRKINEQKSKLPRYDVAIENWDFGGESQIVTQSLCTVGIYGPGGTDQAPDYKGVIGWDGQRAQGVALDFAVCKMSLRFLKRRAEVTMAYKKNVYGMYNCVNLGSFRNFDAGSLRFVGGTLNEREDGDYDITFHFVPDIRREFDRIGEARASDGGEIIVPPHHYVWTKHEPYKETFTDEKGREDVKIIQKARFAYVERVRDSRDFALLQIP